MPHQEDACGETKHTPEKECILDDHKRDKQPIALLLIRIYPIEKKRIHEQESASSKN